jgi:glycosyl-4,4'-diaponeurosporenoate acyltransferase
VIALNVAGWPVIHLSLAWIFTRLPTRWFAGEFPLLRPRRGEAAFYERALGVKHWKKLLPDGAPWLSGVSKRSLRGSDRGRLESFIAETRRGEAAHWAMIATGAVFLLWNPPWADWVMAGYAAAANLPCIITQRFNRFRLRELLRDDHSRFAADRLAADRPAGSLVGR